MPEQQYRIAFAENTESGSIVFRERRCSLATVEESSKRLVAGRTGKCPSIVEELGIAAVSQLFQLVAMVVQ